MARAFLFVLDSFGIGGAPDAADFVNEEKSDLGSNTFAHIAKACHENKADAKGIRAGALSLPTLDLLGLGNAAHVATGEEVVGFPCRDDTIGLWAAATEISKGKDTPSGHWELAGVPVLKDWGYFPKQELAFPNDLLQAIYKAAGIDGSLCNQHSSGLAVIDEFGWEHQQTGQPIFYTSADSVFQIAAHQDHFGLERLYALCEIVFDLLRPFNIARVIARPFIGDAESGYERTANRRDYAVEPPEDSLLDHLKRAGHEVRAIGKIDDIFAHRGTTEVIKAHGNEALFDASFRALEEANDGALVFTNFIDFDQLYGHRRDVVGYANALERFDKRLAHFLDQMRADDLLVVTADHGCDPTWHGTEHTRERVPVLVYSKALRGRGCGIRSSFCDVAQTIANWLNVKAGTKGTSLLDE
ncbi:MAG: phosphopentomutase [Hyphomicrobiales bacterium]